MGNVILEYAEKRGMKIGEERGMKIGEKIGEERGMKIGEKLGDERRAKETARILIAKGYDLGEIAEATGVSLERLREMV